MNRVTKMITLSGLLPLLVFALSSDVLHGRSAATAPALPAPSGAVVNVSTESQLQAAVRKLSSNGTIVLAPGTYSLSSTLSITGTLRNIAIRGGTDNANDVVLVGRGMANASYGKVPNGLSIGGAVDGVLIANLTIRDVYRQAIVFDAGAQNPHVYNVHLVDAGEAFIRSNADAQKGGARNGVVEYSVIEYSTAARDANAAGIDIHTGTNWIVRHNLFRNIALTAGDAAGAALLARDYTTGTTADGNSFLNCARAIAFGFEDKADGSDHAGGQISNNFIFRASGRRGDAAISVVDSPATKVVNNTVFLSGTYSTPIEYRFSGSTAVVLANNLLDGFLWARDGATGNEQNNLVAATTDLFVDATAGDLHLVGSATSAIDHGVELADVTSDWDGDVRSSPPDIGADEYHAAEVGDGSTSATSSATKSSESAAAAAAAAATCPCSIWPSSATPATTQGTGTSAVELGVRFRANSDGVVTGIRFYKGTLNTGTHTGTLWSNTGTKLATATFANETASGWQQVTFSTPVAITANTVYVASYHTNVGQYSRTNSYFTTTGVTNGPLEAPANNVAGANGVYVYGASAFPNTAAAGTNYWVDVVFSQSGSSDTTAPTVSLTSPAGGASVSGATVTVAATATDSVGVVGVQFKLDGANLGTEDTSSPYSVAWNTTGSTNGSHTLTAVARDAAGNSRTSTAITVTVSNADTTAPTVSLTSPASAATVSGTAVTISATATDNIGVAGVQFKVDGVNVGAEDVSSPYSVAWDTTTLANGTHAVTAVARDAAGNTKISTATSVTVSNAVAGGCPCSIWPASATPAVTQGTGTSAVELGVRFRANTAGVVSGLRFYKGSLNTGTHIGNLWTDGGTKLATATFVNETASGWQQVTFSTPVAITANTIYVASYHTDAGQYSRTDAYFATAGVTNGPLEAPANNVAGANGVYVYGASAFPNTSAAATNYWVDVVFAPSGSGSDTTAPTVSVTSPAGGATVSGASVTVSASATDSVGVVGVQFKLDGANLGAEDTSSPYSISWNTAGTTNGTHTLTAVARDAAGNSRTSTAITVTVSNSDTTAPTVSVTSPAGGATVSGTAVTISASATDNVGVAGVQFKVDGVNVGAEDVSSPYSVVWNTTALANGTHTLTAVARDVAGNSKVSGSISVTVSNAAPVTPTTVIFQKSLDHDNAQLTGYRLEIFANGANPNTATALATANLGKPTPQSNGDISVDATSTFNGLAAGTYVVTVASVGPNVARSTPVTVVK